MRRITSNIPLLATLATLCLSVQLLAGPVASAATSPTVNKVAINQAVQEALAKAKGGVGAQGAPPAGATAPGAGEGGSEGALSNLTKGSEEETATQTAPTTPTTSSSTVSTGISLSVVLPVLGIAAVLLAGVAFFIVRDARGVAPAGDGLGSAGSAQDRAARQRKRRAKAKAARRQRKRNR